MSDFSKTWKAMSVEQRAGHILRDWQDSRESNDPMVLRVAAAVAHAVLQELVSKADELRAERDEARREVCSLRRASASCDEGIAVAMREYARIMGWDCFKEDGNG